MQVNRQRSMECIIVVSLVVEYNREGTIVWNASMSDANERR